tara:strand:- start:656 stop:1237 length:582 start_codon:yes stop_codon:yes gene_type:complete
MACTNLTKGRGLDCSRTSGGVRYIYFSVYDEIASFAYDAVDKSVIDTIDFGGNTIYRYAVPRGSTTILDTVTGNTDAGTIFYTPTVNLVYNGLSHSDQQELKLLGSTQVRIFAQLNAQLANGHDIIVAMGMVNGMSLDTGTAESGASFGDRSGYTLNFSGLESQPFAMLEDYTTAPFDNTGFTNKAGTFPTTT